MSQSNDGPDTRDLGIEAPWQRGVEPASPAPSPAAAPSEKRVRLPEERR